MDTLKSALKCSFSEVMTDGDDERIEDWFTNQSRSSYIDLAMNASLQNFIGTSAHRGYNSFKNTLLFRGELLDMDEVLKALDEIRHKCMALYQRMK